MNSGDKELGLHMTDYIENILAENLTLRRKLESKSEALLILSKELNDVRIERDKMKLILEELHGRYHRTSQNKSFCDNEDHVSKSLVENNKTLRMEIDNLRQKLRDAFGDIKALRAKLNHQKWNTSCDAELSAYHLDKQEELVEQLEKMCSKKNQLQMDIQSILDEKEELVIERDAYKWKVHRLNHQLNNLLKGDNQNLIDLDALIMENRYLQERLQQAQEEIQLSNQTVSKYKRMLEKKRDKGSVKLGSSDNCGMLVSQKQVQEILEQSNLNSRESLADLKSLCLATLESLNDKSLALNHQKRANKILAVKISELEQRLENIQGAHVSFPSQLLLDGYSSSDVGKDDDVEIPRIVRRTPAPEPAPIQNVPQEIKLPSEEEEPPLPPELRKLVQDALYEIKVDSSS